MHAEVFYKLKENDKESFGLRPVDKTKKAAG